MAKTATDTGNEITEGYVISFASTKVYFEEKSGALAWAKAGNIPSVSFYTDPSISDAEKLDDLTVGNLMDYSSDL